MHGSHIGIKQIRSHTGHVAYIVPHVVSNDSRVAGIILRNAELHLAGEIGSHIRRFGKDASAGLGKEGQRTGPKREAQQNRRIPGQKQNSHDAQETEAHHGQPHHSASAKADQKGGLQPSPRALGCPRVGLRGHQDADLAGHSRQNRTRQISSRHRKICRHVPLRQDWAAE